MYCFLLRSAYKRLPTSINLDIGVIEKLTKSVLWHQTMLKNCSPERPWYAASFEIAKTARPKRKLKVLKILKTQTVIRINWIPIENFFSKMPSRLNFYVTFIIFYDEHYNMSWRLLVLIPAFYPHYRYSCHHNCYWHLKVKAAHCARMRAKFTFVHISAWLEQLINWATSWMVKKKTKSPIHE